MRVVKTMSFGVSGTNTATTFLGPENGQLICRHLSFTSPGAGTLVVYPASQRTTANAACAASATLVIDTDASGYVGGAVLTTNDLVIIADSSGTGMQLRTISNVAGVSSSTVTLTLGATATCSEDDVIFVVRAANVLTYTVADETVRGLDGAFSGFKNGEPVALLMTATGTCRMCGLVDVYRS